MTPVWIISIGQNSQSLTASKGIYFPLIGAWFANQRGEMSSVSDYANRLDSLCGQSTCDSSPQSSIITQIRLKSNHHSVILAILKHFLFRFVYCLRLSALSTADGTKPTTKSVYGEFIKNWCTRIWLSQQKR